MPPQATEQQPKDNALPAGMSSSRDDDKSLSLTPEAAAGQASDQVQFLQKFKENWNGLSRSQKEEYLKTVPASQVSTILDMDKASMKPGLSVGAAPPFWSVAGLKQGAYDLLGKGLRALPAIGGGLGGWGGAAAGTAVGQPLVGEVVGAGVGGSGGEAARQGVEHLLGWDKGEDYTTAERWKEIGLEGFYNAAGQLFGRGVGKAMGATPERVASKLAFAGGLEHGADALGPSNVSVVLPDLVALEKQMPVKDTKDLARLITQLKTNVGQQVDMAYARPIMQGGRQVPLGNAMAQTGPLVNRVDGVIQKLSINPDINADAIRQLQKIRALALKPRTYRQLADWRIAINDEIGAFYELNPGVKRIAMNTNPDLAAKKEIADAIRDVSYPEMDAVSGQPNGTTAVLQKKRGIAMDMQNQVLKHRKRLLETSEIAAGESPLKRGNFSVYVTGSGRPGGALHKVKNIIKAPNVLKDADTRAASAFGHTFPQKVAKVATQPAVRRSAASAPFYLAARETQRPTADQESPGDVTPPPTPQAAAPPAAPKLRTYKQNFVNSDGHKIGTDDGGQTWFDRETGAEIKFDDTGKQIQ